MSNTAFEERCKTNPEGVIKDLVAQTMRQAKLIHDLNEKLTKLEEKKPKTIKIDNWTS